MKETRFIAQNKEKWSESETLLDSEVKDPEKLSSLFTQVIDDLSYSRTYYPNRSVRVYLNKIARQYFSIIYSHRSGRKNSFKLFWLDELPQIIIHCKKELLISLIFFLASMAIGVFSAINDPDFTASILGDDYVTMTNANIAKGDPMAVYKQSQEMEMFLGITINNLMVAFRTYVLGVFLAIGTLASLLFNGIMVGSFQYFFVERGLFLESALTIWLHGTLEISSIVLAGGAGLTLGRGLIFPGTYSRLQSFQVSAIRSLKLMVGIAPVFVLAGIIESFLTRYTDAPDLLKALIILLSATFIVGYFVVYPWLKSKKGFEEPLKPVRLAPTLSEPVSYGKLKNTGEILKDTFHFYVRKSSQFLPWIFAVSAIQSVFALYLRNADPVSIIFLNWWQELAANMYYGLRTETIAFIFINATSSALIFYKAMSLLNDDAKGTASHIRWKEILQILFITLLMYAVIYLGPWGYFTIICTFGVLLLMTFIPMAEGSNVGAGIANGWTLAAARTKLVAEFQFVILLLTFSFLLVLSAPLGYIYSEYLQWNLGADGVGPWIVRYVEIFIKISAFNMILPLLAAGTGFLYFTLKEIDTATYLKEAIARVGVRSKKDLKR